ncbi:MAG: PKD domain-containing protein, partial [Methanomicrobiales archaeon]|nr:PKD domain-containing protein [Methanomicrobiales archaeon]
MANATNAFTILYPAAPTVASISPVNGVNNGPLTITILGTNFQNGASAFLNLTGQSDINNTTLTVNSPNNITATFQLNGTSTGVWNVVVMNNDGQKGSLPLAFTIKYPAPEVSSINPSSGINTGVINITDLRGDWFKTGATVKLSRANQADIPGTSVLVDTPNRILCLFDLTGKLAGPWNVTVTNPDMQSGTKENGFIVTQPAPTVSAIVPTTGVNNEVKTVNITGTGFKTGVIANLTQGSIIIQNKTPTSVFNDGTLITCSFNLTGAATGPWDVIVTNLDGKSATLSGGFAVNAPGPTITCPVTPSSGKNNEVVGISNIAGSNFQPGASVVFWKDALPQRGATSVSVTSTKITCFIDLKGAQVGPWNVTVRNPDGQNATCTNGFYVFYPQAPHIIGIQPNSGMNIAPINVTITGTGFEADIIANLTLAAPPISGYNYGGNGSPITCTFNLTGRPTGSYSLTVKNNDGQSDTWDGAFTVTAPVPPASITNLHSKNISSTSITWEWTDPTSPDFDHVNVSLNGGPQEIVPKGTQSYTPTGPLTSDTDYTISTHTVGTTGLINQTPVNNTTRTLPIPPVPPASVTNLHNTTYNSTYITWKWTDSTSPDFDHVMVSLSNGSKQIVLKGIQSYTATTLIPATAYTISTQTVGTTGLINQTPVSSTAWTAPCPVASFSVNKTTGDIPLTVQFTDTSTGTITSRNWDFGVQSGGSHDMNPVHTYTTVGLYTVRLEVLSPDCGSNIVTKTNLINATQPKPIADFTGGPASGTAKETEFHFTDLSKNNPITWDWDFGDNSTHSTLQNPNHTYQKSGNYYVTLCVTNAGGRDCITKGPIPVRNPRAIANFTGTPTIGTLPLAVQFTDTSSNIPNRWAWEFGDGTFADTQNPVHTYNTAGSYTVYLRVNDTTAGQPYSDIRRTAYITVTKTPFAEFTASPTRGNAPLAVTFIDQSQGNPWRFSWNFGDGMVSSQKNPTHLYPRPGV